MSPTLTETPTVSTAAGVSTLPTIAVVIAMRNEERAIGACLEAIQAQDYPRDRVEILVVDGGSTDRSRRLVQSYAVGDPRIRLYSNPKGLIPTGLNIGIRASRASIIARVDARTLLAPDYLSTGVRLLQAGSADNVGGPVRSVTPRFAAGLLAAATESRFGMGGAALRYRDSAPRAVDTVYLGMYPRRVLEAIGLYDEEMVRDQDDELNYRLRETGGRVVMTPAMRSTYMNSPSVRRFARQNVLYGYWKVRVFQKHRRMLNWRHLVPPAFVLGLVASPVVALGHPLGAAAVGTCLAVYAAAAVGAAVVGGRRLGGRGIALLPGVFALLHVAWGLGFLAGLVRFLPNWFQVEAAPPALAPLEAAGARA